MAVVAVAIIISFHLKNEPSAMEKRVALPFGLIFWLLAMACLASGLSNYIKTVNRYSRRQALVQSGVATQVVSCGFNRPYGDAALTVCSRCSQQWLVQSLLRAYFSYLRTQRRNDVARLWDPPAFNIEPCSLRYYTPGQVCNLHWRPVFKPA